MTLAPGDAVGFTPPALGGAGPTLVADLGGEAFAAATLTVVASRQPITPSPLAARLAGPTTLGGACPNSAAVPGATWDGSASRAGVRPVLTYAWAVSAGAPPE